jgi:arylsulfatase A-like enzyme
MTGLTPLRHGVHDNGADSLAPEVETLAEILSRYGYATAAFVGAFVLDRQFGLAQGFQHYDDNMAGGKLADQFCYAERNAKLVTDAAFGWLSRRDDQPAFIWIHFFDPHNPYEAPGYDPTFSALTDYDAEINFADSQLKRIVDFFEQQDRPTLFLVAADHGEGLGDHGEPTHGMLTYNTTLHVPLVVQFPNRRHKSTQINSPVSLVDIMPSVLKWVGLPLPSDVDGHCLPLNNEGSAVADETPRRIYFENYFVFNNYGWSPLVGVIWNDWKFIQAPRPELYNLTEDPDERIQLYEKERKKAEQLDSLSKSFIADLRARGVFAAKSIELQSNDLARLESLGYAGGLDTLGASPPAVPPDAPDPKDMVGVLAKIHSATIAMEQKRMSEAADLLIQVASQGDPGNPRAVKMLAVLFSEAAEKRREILTCLQQARQRGRPELDIFSLTMLGEGLFAEQQYDAAIEIFQEVIHRAPHHAISYRYLGDCRRELRQFDEAARNYQQSIDLATLQKEPPLWLDYARQQLAVVSKNAAKSER